MARGHRAGAGTAPGPRAGLAERHACRGDRANAPARAEGPRRTDVPVGRRARRVAHIGALAGSVATAERAAQVFERDIAAQRGITRIANLVGVHRDRRRARVHGQRAARDQRSRATVRRAQRVRRSCRRLRHRSRSRPCWQRDPQVILSADDTCRPAGPVVPLAAVQGGSRRTIYPLPADLVTRATPRSRTRRGATCAALDDARPAPRANQPPRRRQSTSLPFSWRASTRATTNSRSDSRFR